jgi:NitT/TauT family transport system substrate-binding protein
MLGHSSSRPARTRFLARTATVAAAALLLAACGSDGGGSTSAQGQGSGKPAHVTIGVGGQTLLPYLPTTLAQQLGCYQKAGVDVELQDLGSGSKALQAMLGGSTDVTSGYYDHTIQMAAKHQDITAFVNMLRYPALVLAVAPGKQINSVADLKGKSVGVTAPGSSTDFFLKYMLDKAGLPADAASVQAIGADATAVAAMEQGQVDAAVMLDPAFSQLEARAGDLKILADTRTQKGTEEVYGTSTYPAAVLYVQQSYIKDNPDTVRSLAQGVQCALDFIKNHSAEEIAAKMPEQFAGGNKDIYVKAIAALKDAYNPTGKIEEDGAKAVEKVLGQGDPQIAQADVDVSKTYTNEFLGQ